MAVISVRELLRDATTVFEGMERDREPVLITRRGRPVAALVPVNPEQAEAMILSSAPALIESRRRAEQAIAEGRTTPLEDAPRDAVGRGKAHRLSSWCNLACRRRRPRGVRRRIHGMSWCHG